MARNKNNNRIAHFILHLYAKPQYSVFPLIGYKSLKKLYIIWHVPWLNTVTSIELTLKLLHLAKEPLIL